MYYHIIPNRPTVYKTLPLSNLYFNINFLLKFRSKTKNKIKTVFRNVYMYYVITVPIQSILLWIKTSRVYLIAITLPIAWRSMIKQHTLHKYTNSSLQKSQYK